MSQAGACVVIRTVEMVMELQHADSSKVQEGNKTVFCQLWHHDFKDPGRCAILLRHREGYTAGKVLSLDCRCLRKAVLCSQQFGD